MNLVKNYYTSSNYTGLTSIPIKEEFNKYASNLITLGDFDTDHTNCCQVTKVAGAIDWTFKHCKKGIKKGTKQ